MKKKKGMEGRRKKIYEGNMAKTYMGGGRLNFPFRPPPDLQWNSHSLTPFARGYCCRHDELIHPILPIGNLERYGDYKIIFMT